MDRSTQVSSNTKSTRAFSKRSDKHGETNDEVENIHRYSNASEGCYRFVPIAPMICAMCVEEERQASSLAQGSAEEGPADQDNTKVSAMSLGLQHIGTLRGKPQDIAEWVNKEGLIDTELIIDLENLNRGEMVKAIYQLHSMLSMAVECSKHRATHRSNEETACKEFQEIYQHWPSYWLEDPNDLVSWEEHLRNCSRHDMKETFQQLVEHVGYCTARDEGDGKRYLRMSPSDFSERLRARVIEMVIVDVAESAE